MPQENDDVPNLGDTLAEAVENLQETPVSDDLISRCRMNALSLDMQRSTKVQSQASWVTRWAVPITVAASLVIVMNIGQTIARWPSRDRQLAAIESCPDGSMHRLYSDRVSERFLISEFHRTGTTQ